MSFNKVILIGRLGDDPELRNTQSGTAVCNMSLATNRTWRDQSNEQQEETEWHRVVAWGNLAETCGNYLEKGRQIAVEGRLQTNEWEDNDGNTRYTTEVVANNIQFLGSRGDTQGVSGGGPRDQRQSQGGGGPAPNSGGGQQGGGQGGGDYSESFDDDDIPF
jgi:single-strand DNA-binding protein